MSLSRIGIVLALTALVGTTLPAAPARADGAASTRNIILGGALAGGTLLIINHNKKVHQKEDELSNARNQAQAERDQAYSSYQQAAASANAYRRQLAVENREMVALKRQVAQLRKQVSSAQGTASQSAFIAAAPRVPLATNVAYGWGQL
jgi:hypothetical protein